ncbi:MAG: folate/biopterin family MFS transporter [Microcoleus sp. PH2017_10_PVI_O_A]|uniref:folate/biopterin family MFS transporter n=1 Tax=unclassified Microcoleus TaxID=2642155 RepID=UPI001D2EA915|nr:MULTISPECIES: folate/biopterin family MFS transporter [unclassified Microcoleus]TAE77600.1 MAG: folate/biopterin family MFS transporter [Oscillatoriales cyanobacterium]MCC3408784.1 folate/biopterin family MFS transporter [Microcoleus sp. PH2017_10_PVI_O_A]MCC3462911.1 folate/biopterin family MFS transporter [Microcoleus sp. PH2017_11_PCY_U_A]MCC3481616.1 folate/biopterin family MFS transporter [Microcoleus sp. PH2017_12_PCY_D_A]MCC3527213.1 folate/biopterin family MFS transporter [Microcole
MLLSPSGASKLKESLKEKVFFGNEPTPELIAILLIYFVQGILGLARLAVSFFLKDELGMSPAEVSAMLGVVALPWIIKPLFGFMSDGLPLFGYRRRPYIVLSGLLGTSAWVSLATIVHTPLAATGAIALSSLSLAVSDVIADSLVVERARKETVSDAGSLQSLSWGASALGGLITAYLSGSLLQNFSTHTIFLITASFPLIVSATAWLISEEKINKRTDFETVKDQLKQLRQAVTQKTIWLPTAFLFLWQATPSSDSAFFFFTTNELGFQPEFLGRVRLVTSIAALAGIWLFQRYLKAIPFRVIFGWSTVVASALGMTTLLLVTHANRALGIDDQWFSIGDSLILTVIGQIAYMPVLVLSARLCPPGVEATLFAVLMSVTNLAGLISYEGGAILTHWLGITDRNFDNLWLLVVIANLSTLLPLPFLNWLPAESTESGDPNYQQSLPVLEPELGCAKPGGQHFMPEYFPDLVPTSIPENRTVESK